MAIAVVVAGCGAGGGQARHAASHPPASTSPAAPSVITGSQLARLLPPQAAPPPGWRANHGRSSTLNKTPRIPKPLADLGPTSSFSACTNWGTGLDADELMFLWELSYAWATARPPHLPAGGLVTLQVANFRPGDAARQLAWDTSFAARCRSYRDTSDGSRITVTAAAVPHLGDQALYVQLVNPYRFGGDIIHAHSDVLLARVGNNMVGVSQDGDATNPADPVVGLADLKQGARYLIAALSRLGR